MPKLENFRLKVFRAVADQLSFRRAAEQLFLTQPAVTLQVKALEDDLGVRLFDRAAGRISLTRQGALLLGYAQEISKIIDKAEQELAAAEGQVSGKLDLGVSTTIAQYVLPRLIAAFLTENPRVSLSLHSGNTDEVVQFVLQEKASAGLIEGPPRKRGVHAEPFMRDELVLIVPGDFESDDVSRDQLLASTLLMRERGSGSRSVVETALVKAGVKLKTLRNMMNLDSTEAIKSAVEAGLGIGFVSRWAISKELELGLLRVANVTGIRIVRPFSLISRTGPEPQGPAGVFRAFVLGRARLLSSRPKNSRQSANSSR